MNYFKLLIYFQACEKATKLWFIFLHKYILMIES